MATTVDQRVVEMRFDNAQFEKNVKQSMNSLNELDKSVESLKKFSGREMMSDLGSISTSAIAKFTILGNIFTDIYNTVKGIGATLVNKVIDPVSQMATRGWARALNIENAKFQFEGLGMDIEQAMKDADFAVKDTAYSLDAAATAATQLASSGIKLGDDMQHALRGVSGVAAQTNSSYEEIAHVFTRVAGQGRLMGQDLQSLATRGLNAAATLAEAMHISEAEVRDMVSKGKISFKQFSDIMYYTFGEHAVKANETYEGSLANVGAALAKIGADFQQYKLQNMQKVFNSERLALNKLRVALTPLSEEYGKFVELATTIQSKLIDMFATPENARALKVFIDGLLIILSKVLELAMNVANAFKELFPKDLNFNLLDLAMRFKEFATNLTFSAETAQKIYDVINGIISIFGIFKLVLTSIAKTVMPNATASCSTFLEVVLTLAAGLGRVISMIYQWLDETQIIRKVFETIKLVALMTVVAIAALVSKIKELYTSITQNEKIISFFDHLKTFMVDAFSTIIEWAGKAKDALVKFFNIGGGAKAGSTIKKTNENLDGVETTVNKAAKIFEKVKEFASKITGKQVAITLIIGALTAFAIALAVAANKMSNGVQSIAGAFTGFKKFLSDIAQSKEAAKAKQKFIHFIEISAIILTLVYNLRKIAEADLPSILAAGSVVIAVLIVAKMILKELLDMQADVFNSNKLRNILTSISILFVSLGTAISSIVRSIKKLGDQNPDTLGYAMAGVVGALGAVALIVKALDKIAKGNLNARQMSAINRLFIVLAADIVAIGLALSMAAKYDWNDLAASALGITLVLGALIGVTAAIGNMKMRSQAEKRVAYLLLISLSVIPIAHALGQAAKYDWNGSLLHAVLGIGGVLLELVGTLAILQKIKKTGAAEKNARSLLVLSLSLIPIAYALNKVTSVANWDDLGHKMLAIGGTLAIVAGILSGTTFVLSKIGFGAKTALIILAIGAAIVSFGAAMALAGVGIDEFAVACQKLQYINFKPISEGMKMIFGALEMASAWNMLELAILSAALPPLGAGLIALAEGIDRLGNVDVSKITDNFVAFFTVLKDELFKLGVFSAELGFLGGNLLALAIPLALLSMPIIALGVACTFAGLGFLAFAGGIRLISGALVTLDQVANWDEIVAGFQGFADAISNLPIIRLWLFKDGLYAASIAIGVFTAAAVVLTFVDINGLSAAISQFGDACIKLSVLSAILVPAAIAIGALAAAMKIFDAVMAGLASTLPTNVQIVITELSKLTAAGKYAVAGFVDGINSSVGSVAKAGLGMAKSLVGSVCGYLGIASPSKFFRTIGEFTGSGFCLGIADKLDAAAASGEELGVIAAASAQAQEYLFGQAGARAGGAYANGVSSVINSLGIKIGNYGLHPDQKGYSTTTSYAKTITEEAMSGLNDLTNGMFGLDKITDEVEKSMKEATGAAGDYGDALGGAGGKAKQAEDEFKKLHDTIQGQINLFEEFNKETDLTADKLLENMKSQISGAAEWTNWIHQLGERGLSGGLLKKLADMGQQNGYKYAKAFMDMSAEQLSYANVFYASSLTIPDNAMFAIQDSFSMAGEWAAHGFANGITKDAADENVTLLGLRTLDKLKETLDEQSPSKKTEEIGMYAAKGLAVGLLNGSANQVLIYNINRLCTDIITRVRKGLSADNFKQIGQQVVNGIKNGINDSTTQNSLFTSVISLCNKVKDAATSPKGFWERSPSRVFEEIGSYVSLGLAEGISKSSSAPVNSILGVTDDVKAGMRTAIDAIRYAFDSDVDLTPTIRPVVDLTDVQTGIDSINDLMPSSRINVGSTSRYLPSDISTSGGNGDVVSAVNSLKEDVAYLGEAITNMQMVLDTGTMVGAMTPAIDQQLYTRQVYAGRGM